MTEITANYDETWKEVIGDYFESFLLFFYPHIHKKINWEKTPVPLDKELEQITASSQTEKRHADKLFKVWLLDGQEVWILIHLEVQSQYDKEFPLRMYIYNYRAFDLYQKPVISLAILGDESKTWRPNSYEYGMGESKVTMKFSIVKLVDYQWPELEQNQNIFAIVVMAHLKTKATTSNLSTREQWKWQLSRLLYERGYNRKEIVDLYKVIDLMMTLPPELQSSFEGKINEYEEQRKMPLLSNIERRALERGQAIGQAIGQERGQKTSTQKHIIKLLQKRFGELPKNLLATINEIEDISLLERLILETISVNSVGEFAELIKEHSSGEN